MTEPLDPARRVEPPARSRGERRSGADRREPSAPANALVALSPQPEAAAPPARDDTPGGAAEFHAQLLGGGPRRGLKGGRETLDEARSTYLETEYSGPADRRPRKGTLDREV